MTKEAEMFPITFKHLQEQGYRILEANPGRTRGKDIVAEKDGKRLILELKGDTKAMDVDFGTAIYQLLRYMNEEESELGLVLTPNYVRYVNRVTVALGKLGIKILIVSGKTITQLM